MIDQTELVEYRRLERKRESSRRWRKRSGAVGRTQDAEHKRRRRVERPDAVRNNRLKHDFGITLVDYDRMLAEQRGVCKICKMGSTCKGKPERLSVDHNHETGKVRGLLCRRCNRALGAFRDNPDVLRAAIEYLE